MKMPNKEEDIVEEREDEFYTSNINYKKINEIVKEKKEKAINNNNRNVNISSDIKLVILMTIAFVLGAVIMLLAIKYTPILGSTGTGNTVITKDKTKVYEKSSLAPAVKKIYDAVVVVNNYQKNQKAGSGTGFVYKVDDEYGYLLTNHHVVDGAEKVSVVFTDENEVDVKVLGSDEYLDLAVLRVEKKYVSLISNIGSSEKMEIGDTVFTVGAPVGYEYRGSVTSGVLSGKDRMMSVSVTTSENDWVMRVLQIDASINPGNSGGPLLNVNGEVIGICSMKLVNDSIEGMGFAIPIEYAMSHVDELEKEKSIEWPVFGISMANVTDTKTLYSYGVRIDSSIEKGVVVLSTADGTAAAEAKLKKGDVITKLGGNKTDDIAHLRYELYQHSAGDEIEIEYIRDKKTHTVKVKLTKNSD